jgi:hypothetical protein
VLVAAACGCGTSRKSVPLSSWLSFRAGDKTAKLRLVAAYNDAYNGFNFNGYAKGQVLVEIPQGWRVEVRCVNGSQDMRHSCAVVRGLSGTPAFSGAASQSLSPGSSAAFSFVATRRGSYRIVCLVPGHEQEGMWNALDVTRARLPAVVLLRRSP